MNKDFYNTPDKCNIIISNCKNLQHDAGWLFVTGIVEENIRVLSEQLLSGFEGETKDQIDIKRAKLLAYKEVLGTPQYWIDKLTSEPATPIEEPDPYFTVESLKKKRKLN